MDRHIFTEYVEEHAVRASMGPSAALDRQRAWGLHRETNEATVRMLATLDNNTLGAVTWWDRDHLDPTLAPLADDAEQRPEYPDYIVFELPEETAARVSAQLEYPALEPARAAEPEVDSYFAQLCWLKGRELRLEKYEARMRDQEERMRKAA